MSDSSVLAKAFEGQGGLIDASNVGQLFSFGNSLLDSSSNFGTDGTVLVPSIVNRELNDEELITEFLDVSSLLMKSCSGYIDDSELSYASYQGVIASPEGLASSLGMNVASRADSGVAQLMTTARGQQEKGDYRRSANTLDLAYQLAQKKKDNFAMAASLGELGNALIAAGKPGSAKQTLVDAIALATRLNNSELNAQLNNGLGNFFVAENNLSDALLVYKKSQKIIEQLNAKDKNKSLEAARVYANIARVHLLQSNVKGAFNLLAAGERHLPGKSEGPGAADVRIHMAKSYEMAIATATSMKK